MKRAVFLDRDGTIIQEENYLSDPERVRLIPGVSRAIRQLNRAGYLVIVVSNQSGVARGMFSMRDVELVNDKMCQTLAEDFAKIDAIYCCPHHPAGIVPDYACACTCRKPLIGMAQQAQREWNIDLTQSFMIGDKQSDVQFGQKFGAKQSFLVQTGYGHSEAAGLTNVICVDSAVDAIKMILNDKEESYMEGTTV